MKIFITGGLGFIGRHLSNFLLNRGHQVTAVGTRPTQNLINHKNFSYISADTTQKGGWQDELQNVDAVINLAGRSIFKRWNKSYKQLINFEPTQQNPNSENCSSHSRNNSYYFTSRGPMKALESKSSERKIIHKSSEQNQADYKLYALYQSL